MRKSRIPAMTKKEFRHIWRDPRSLSIIILLPVLMLILYGYAIDLDIDDIALGVLDTDKSNETRELISAFEASGYFTVEAYPQNREQIEPLIRARQVRTVLVFPRDFSEKLNSGKKAEIQIIIDGSDSNAATIIRQYSESIINTYVMTGRQSPFTDLFDIRTRVFFNPNLESSMFYVPGLIAVILMMISALLTSITIARERESGTLEQILVCPLKPYEMIIGKVIPYVFLAFLDGLIILALGRILFGVQVKGSLLLLNATMILYIFAALGIGLLISTIAKTQQVAMMLSAVSTILPSILLSGFIFPISSMPKLLQAITHIIPARYFVVIIRGIILKGTGPAFIWRQCLFLFVFGILLVLLSTRKFSSTLD